ncbi:MAG: outer membrane beta-barrel protein [Ignavibacteriae bacterium]|jgi:hypothetical protein|nr:hypothetical protein [Ignavibacteriota bacterium]NOG99519.1 outer membrane beta-barrel protein [Ignavibacteriota bacterium]
MKTQLIIFLLIFLTSSMFAQIDTIYTKKGDVYPCTIVELDDDKIITFDNNGSELKVYHFLIDKVYFDSYEEIYTAEKGYTIDVDELEPALEWRLELIEEEKENRKAVVFDNNVELVNIKNNHNRNGESCNSKSNKPNFSFGVFYVPYSLEKKIFYFDSYRPSYAVIDDYSAQIESQFSYHLKDRLFAICNVSFNSATIKDVMIEKREYFNPPNSNDSGYETETSLKLLTIEVGFKYYFMKLFSNQVSAYVQLGAGKTLAWGDYSHKNLFEDDPPPYYYEENRGEYLEDSNSPFLLQAGFGTEYFFNESLSIHSSIRVYYSTTSAKYETVQKDDYSLRVNSKEEERTDVLTKVGLGLNFYF